MAYMSNTLISRRGYFGPPLKKPTLSGQLGGLGAWYDSLATGFSSGVTAEQQQVKASADLQAAIAAQQGPGIGTLLLIGGAAVAAIVLAKRKSRG